LVFLLNLFAQTKLTPSVKSSALPEVHLPNKHHFQTSVRVAGLFNPFPQLPKKNWKDKILQFRTFFCSETKFVSRINLIPEDKTLS